MDAGFRTERPCSGFSSAYCFRIAYCTYFVKLEVFGAGLWRLEWAAYARRMPEVSASAGGFGEKALPVSAQERCLPEVLASAGGGGEKALSVSAQERCLPKVSAKSRDGR